MYINIIIKINGICLWGIEAKGFPFFNFLWRRPGTDLNRNHHDQREGGSYQNDQGDCQTKQNPSRNTRVKQSQVTTSTMLLVES